MRDITRPASYDNNLLTKVAGPYFVSQKIQGILLSPAALYCTIHHQRRCYVITGYALFGFLTGYREHPRWLAAILFP